MKPPTPKRPSPGTVLGLLALIVALAGNADAFTKHTLVRKGDIAPGAVTAKSLAKGAVHAKALAQGAVTSRALKSAAVATDALANDAVTAAKLKDGSVGSSALAAEAVTARTIKAGAVTPAALAPNAVTASALAPGSVYGGALGSVSVHTTPIADLDETADLSTWTTSNTESANCAPGQRLLSGGIVFTNPGNRRVAIVRAVPFSTGLQDGISAQITTDSGGTAAAEVQALCLK